MHIVTFTHKVARRGWLYGEQCCPRWFLNYGVAPALADDLLLLFAGMVPFASQELVFKEQLAESVRGDLIAKADAACRHEFDLLGSGPFCFGGRIDWHLDFKSGFQWPERLLYSRIPAATASGAEIKVPWELSRFSHGVTLGLAWQISKDRKYPDEFIAQVDAWIESNPVGLGVNWACPMDVSIRAVNWLVAAALLADPLMKSRHSDFRKRLVQSLWQHAGFLRTHLEWNGSKADSGANHLLSDFAGLFTLGLFFNKTAKGRRWFRFAHEQIEKQMLRQVFPDGVHFECSPAYHRLVLEMFMWCGSLARRAGEPFSPAYDDRLKKMQRFAADCMNPAGRVPLIGDADDGRFLTSGVWALTDHRYLLPEDKVSGVFSVDRFLLDGTVAVKTGVSSGSAEYPCGGFYFLGNQSARLVVRAGRLAYAGGHAHNDQASFEFHLEGAPVFVDRGTCVYTSNSAVRNRHRSTAAHNVVQINGVEQNRFGSGLFVMPDETRTNVVRRTETTLDAVHYGFQSLKRPDAEYRRCFGLTDDTLEICDTATGLKRGDRVRWFFHLAPGLTARICGNQVSVSDAGIPVCSLTIFSAAQVSVQDFPHSPSYGVIEPAKVIVVEHVVAADEQSESCRFEINWEKK